MKDHEIEDRIDRAAGDIRLMNDGQKSIGLGLAVVGYCLLQGCRVIARAIAYGSTREDNEDR